MDHFECILKPLLPEWQNCIPKPFGKRFVCRSPPSKTIWETFFGRTRHQKPFWQRFLADPRHQKHFRKQCLAEPATRQVTSRKINLLGSSWGTNLARFGSKTIPHRLSRTHVLATFDLTSKKWPKPTREPT